LYDKQKTASALEEQKDGTGFPARGKPTQQKNGLEGKTQGDTFREKKVNSEKPKEKSGKKKQRVG